MSDAQDSDKDKKSSAAVDNTQTASVSQPAPANAGHTGYQFFVDGSAGGYSFGLGQTDSTSAPQMDTSLPDWFTNTSAPITTSAPSFSTATNPASTTPSPTPGPAPVFSPVLDMAPAQNLTSVHDTTPKPSFAPLPGPAPAPAPVAPSAPPAKRPQPPVLPSAPSESIPSSALYSQSIPAQSVPSASSLSQQSMQQAGQLFTQQPAQQFTQQPSPQPAPQSLINHLQQAAHPVIAAAPPPVAAVRHVPGAPRPVPLDLRFDERFNKLSLPNELSQTVERIFSLNDLDFNGFVDFDEITTMLKGEELTTSEKQFVQMIYQVGKKIVAERPVGDNNQVPVMSKEDFKLAFASVLKGVLPGFVGGTGEPPAVPQPTKSFRPTLYAEDDYPLGSIKAQAVKLGTMGDAYFAACLVSMIDLQPRSIMRMINNSHDQTYLITFPGLHGKSIELMPPRAEEIVHYGLAETYGYWYPLVEKGYGMYIAQQHKLAAAMEKSRDSSSRVAQAMEALTSAQVGTLIVADFEPVQLRDRILEKLAKGKIAVAISNDGISQAATVAGAAPLPLQPYAVQGFNQGTDRMIVRGVGTVNTFNLDESVLKLTIEQFAHYFKIVYYEKDLENQRPANIEIHPAKPGNNPWRKLPGE